MDFEQAWRKALQYTEIVRTRVQPLVTMGETRVPYILLCESAVNEGDTVVRKGNILVEKPSLIVPPNNPQFIGFDMDVETGVDQNSFINFLLVRGVTIPSLRYDNKTNSLDIFEKKLSEAIKYYRDLLQREENVQTGLIVGPQDCWQFSLLIFICMQIARNAEYDIKKLLEEYHKKKKWE
ncbi:MAG TPA: hypothetical protein DD723_00350 [Candidatus Omnitrophica bacterium]|nr:MAG: hypothetical protein A2Z81_04620 [Omnitrophica WOR_2 bacterium GWA2_45_18]HBR13982.1 hypothetical protein [Candidatus Omnitrophota bacterium]